MEFIYRKYFICAFLFLFKEAYKKAQKLIEQTDIPKGATEMSCNNCKTLENLLDTVKNGGSLSEEEKEGTHRYKRQ